MKPYYEEPNITIYHGDCLEIMPQLEPVDLVLTDPPYNAGKDYGTYKDALSDFDYYDSYFSSAGSGCVVGKQGGRPRERQG